MIEQAEQPFSLSHFGRLLFQNRKKAGMYGLLFIIVSFNLCLFLPANMHSPSAERAVNAFQLVCFVVMGIVNVWFFYRRNFLAELCLSGAKLAFICLVFIAMALVLFVYYLISGNNGLIMAFASSGAFLLPFLVYQAWLEYLHIPAKNYPAWYLPEESNEAAFTGGKTIQVQLKIARKETDAKGHLFPVTTPAKIKLGRMFERFIADRQLHGSRQGIDTRGADQQLSGWQFYEEKWGGLYSRYLNPLMSLAENNIKPNAIIAVVRAGAA